MRVLVIGGSGFVGGLILPALRRRHDVLIYDRVAPADGSLPYMAGDVTDPAGLAHACRDCQAVVYLAMGPFVDDVFDTSAAYDVNCKGLHLALEAAAAAGVRRVVHASTGSIYGDPPTGSFPSEDMPCRPVGVYPLTKHFGEQICEHFARVAGLSVIALRIWLPVTEATRRERASREGVAPSLCTDGDDLARAFLSALDVEHSGFDAVFIAGDPTERTVALEKARRLLGWQPSPGPGADAEPQEGASSPTCC